MNKTRKGITLVEVIVSIAVFTIISLALFSSFLAMRKVVFRQEEYVRLEMVCYDINYYWDIYGDEWDEKYFGKDMDGKGYLKYENGEFVPTSTKSNYEVKYSYTGDNNEVLLIEYIKSSDRYYAENVYCGGQDE